MNLSRKKPMAADLRHLDSISNGYETTQVPIRLWPDRSLTGEYQNL